MLAVAEARPRGVRARGAEADYLQVPAVVRWSFIAFAAVLPFEAANLAFTSSTFSLAKLTGLLFFGCYLFFYNPLSGKRPFPGGSPAFICFTLYAAVFIAHGLFLDAYYRTQFVSVLATLLQLLLLFWICSSLLRVEALTRIVWLAFAFGAALSAAGTLFGLPGFAVIIESRGGERITAMGFNPNYFAYTMALAAVVFANAALDPRVKQLWRRGVLAALVLPLLAVIVRTGSRTGLLAFAVGFVICLLPHRNAGRKGMLIFLTIVVGSALTYLVLTNHSILERFQETSRGDLSGRQLIAPASIEMIFQRPVLGWHPIVYWEELGRRVGQIWGARDAHNMIFHIMLEVGLLGAIPFFLGIGFCLISAWRARQGKFGNLPLALLTMTLVANLSHTFVAHKPQWMVFALAIAAAYAARRSNVARFLIRQPLRSSGRAFDPAYAAQVRPRHF